MIFNSYIFIILFLPFCLLGFFGLSRLSSKIYADLWLIICSGLFCVYGGIKGMLVIAAFSVINFLMGIAISRCTMGHRKPLFATGVLVNVFYLLLCKYLGLFGSIVSAIVQNDINLNNLFAPLGISFITFSQLSFLIYIYKNPDSLDISGEGIREYLLYILWFPKLIQGPICNYEGFVDNLHKPERYIADSDNISEGLILFAIGLAKKLLVADCIAKSVNTGFAYKDNLGVLSVIFIVLAYTLQIYMDFSGYSDMALGVSQMFNIDIPINFNSPYKAISITGFWRRWHISLTDFLRENLYFPLGGNQLGTTRTLINILVVFAISGLWHGANVTFVVWGLLHGICQVIERVFKKQINHVPTPIRFLFTFAIINLGWLLFRCESIGEYVFILSRLGSRDNISVLFEIIEAADLFGFSFMIDNLGSLGAYLLNFSGIIVMLCGYVMCFFLPTSLEIRKRKTVLTMIMTGLFIVISVFMLQGAMTTFIYFDF